MRLTRRIHLVGSGVWGFGLSHASDCHVYLIDGGSEAALIDAGAGVDTAAVLALIDESGVPRDRIRHLFISHAHADHAGGAAGLRDALGLTVHAAPEVAAIMETGDEAKASVSVGRAQGTYAPDYVYRAVDRVERTRDGERVRIGEVEIEVVATPGHAAGHNAYLLHREGGADLFTGDTLLFGGVIVLQSSWDCDLGTHLDSLRRLAGHPHDGFFPGHLAFSVTDGARHVRAAVEAIERGAIPRTLF
jgi:glyoxylase-like metal-dependent hydrolase (beta-lactamase superfamily II)